MVALQFSADSNYTGDVFQHVKRKTVFKSKNFGYIGHFYEELWQTLGGGVIVCVYHILFVNNIVLNKYTN